MKKRKQIRRGTMGWDMSYPFKILATQTTHRFGRVFIVQFVSMDDQNKPKTRWLEAMLETNAKKLVGPDCEGELPQKKWFTL